MSSKFSILLEDLSKQLSIKLKVDDNESCLLSFANGLEVQVELTPNQEEIIIGSNLGELPAGKFREDCLKEALIRNDAPYPRCGNFSYSKKLNSLILFEKLSLTNLSVDLILKILTPFIQKAKTWKESLGQGRTPLLQEDNLDQDKPFGL